VQLLVLRYLVQQPDFRCLSVPAVEASHHIDDVRHHAERIVASIQPLDA